MPDTDQLRDPSDAPLINEWSEALLPGSASKRLRTAVGAWLQVDLAFRAAARQAEAALAPHGLSRTSFILLGILSSAAKGLTAATLANAAGRPSSAVSGLVQRLERNGLCSRNRADHDARSTIIAIASDGERVLREAVADYGRWVAKVCSSWRESDIEELLHVSAVMRPAGLGSW